MFYGVYVTEIFEKKTSNLTNFDKKILNKIYLQLKENPYVGDSIRYKFFREKRLKEKRIYYLIYEELKCVLIVAFGGKKRQQKTIDEIIEMLPYFKKYIKEILGDSFDSS